MRLIFATQSTGLNLFWRLYGVLASNGGLGRCGFLVTNRHEYTQFEHGHPEFRSAELDVVREWSLLDQAGSLERADLEQIAKWEHQLGDASLWNALIIDRRMGFPLKAQFRQCYEAAYGHEDLLKMLQVALDAVAGHLDRVRPHAVVGLNGVTLYDYLYYLMARQRGIPYMQLKLTRIRNYVSWFTDPFELSPHIVEMFRKYASGETPDEGDCAALGEACDFLDAARGKTLVYEGAINRPGHKPQTQGPAKAAAGSSRSHRFRAWGSRLAQLFHVRDQHYPTIFHSLMQMRLVRPLRRCLQRFRFDIEDSAAFAAAHAGAYAVYPLNTEPEVALLAFGRPYRNQIETVRNLAAALPVGWKLVVKEHPNAYGYRTSGYYRKLKQIPNVLLAGPKADTGSLTDGCALVALVYGTIGLEAIIKRKPLLIFSPVPYSVFPSEMVRMNENPWRLGHDVRTLLDSYRYDEKQVEAYVAAHIRTGIRINLFTGLLAKGGRQAGEPGRPLEEQYNELACHTRQRIVEEQGRLAAGYARS